MNDFIIIFLVIISFIFIIFISTKVAEIINTKLGIYGDFSMKEFIVVATVSISFGLLYSFVLLYFILGPNNFYQWWCNYIYI